MNTIKVTEHLLAARNLAFKGKVPASHKSKSSHSTHAKLFDAITRSINDAMGEIEQLNFRIAAVIVTQRKGQSKLLMPGNGVEHTGTVKDILTASLGAGMLKPDQMVMMIGVGGVQFITEAKNLLY